MLRCLVSYKGPRRWPLLLPKVDSTEGSTLLRSSCRSLQGLPFPLRPSFLFANLSLEFRRDPTPMPLRSGGRKVSFDLLAGDSSGDDGSLSLRQVFDPVLANGGEDGRSTRRKRKSKASKKKKFAERAAVAEDPGRLVGLDLQKPSLAENGHHEDGMELSISESRSVVESVCENTVVEPAPEPERSQVSCVSFVELRQRNVNGSVGDEPGDEEADSRETSAGQWRLESKGKIPLFGLKKKKISGEKRSSEQRRSRRKRTATAAATEPLSIRGEEIRRAQGGAACFVAGFRKKKKKLLEKKPRGGSRRRRREGFQRMGQAD